MFQASRGRARVPLRLREAIRPLAERSFSASRTTVREAPIAAAERDLAGHQRIGRIATGDDRRTDLFSDALGAIEAIYSVRG